MVIKELALANKRAEIIAKLNQGRAERNLPILPLSFDLYYYQKQYAPLIEDLSLHYANHLSKKYRFANRINRIAKLNEIAETVLDRIRVRESEKISSPKVEELHNQNIKLFSMLVNSIDEQMGKLKLTKIDMSVRSANSPSLENPEDVKRFVTEALKKYTAQLPSSVDANFSEITDYEKCAWGEEWTASTFCKYHGEPCKVQSGEIKACPFFLNNILLNNKEYIFKRYLKDNLSIKQITELLGCKEPDKKILEYVRNRVREYGLNRARPDSTD